MGNPGSGIQPLASLRRSSRGRQGFTLVETVIVMTILLGVISAIFAAASMVRYRMQVNEASDQLALIVGNIRALYSGQNVSYDALNSKRALNAAATPTDFNYYTPIFKTQGVFPRDMLINGVGGFAYNPWNSTAAGGSVQAALAGTASTGVQLVVRYTLPSDPCVDMAVRNSVSDMSTGLVRIRINAGTGGPTWDDTGIFKLPVSPVDVTTTGACGASGDRTIDWYYRLGS